RPSLPASSLCTVWNICPWMNRVLARLHWPTVSSNAWGFPCRNSSEPKTPNNNSHPFKYRCSGAWYTYIQPATPAIEERAKQWHTALRSLVASEGGGAPRGWGPQQRRVAAF